MDVLDNDSLIHIFDEFKFRQKVALLESVCQRWNRILKSHASHSKMQSVNIADFVGEKKVVEGEYEATISGVIGRAGPHIHELDLGHRWPRIHQCIVDQILQKCSNLTKLDMGWARLEADISQLLEKVASQLTEFSLEETSWSNERNAEKVVDYIPKMKRLQKLNLRKYGEPLEGLEQLDSGMMESLDVSECSQLFPDTLVAFLETNPQLRVLHLCPMPSSCLSLFAMSTTSSINLPGPFMGFVPQPKQLRRRFFSVKGDEVLKKKPKKKCSADLQALINKLATLKQLRTLWLGHIPHVAHFLSLKPISEMAELRHLHIKECNALDGTALDALLTGVSETLRQLSLFNCTQIDDFGALAHCTVLSQLDIEKGKHLKCTDLEALSQHGRLRILRLKDCPAISDRIVWTTIEQCPSLKELELINCTGISAELFIKNDQQTFSKAQKLERLSLSGCEAITRPSILQGIEVLKWDTLCQLDLSQNMNIDDTILEAVRDKLGQQNAQKPLTLHAAGTSITREAGKRVEPFIELTF